MLSGFARTPGRWPRRLRAALAERRSIATLEFALIAPVLATMIVGTFDIGRALIIWQQLNNAAEAIAQAAEKTSITVNNNGTATQLTPQQMQDAMTSIYAQMPGLNLGNGTGPTNGAFSVTLSSVVFYPVCTYANSALCNGGPQAPYTAWSSYLTLGGSQLMQPPTTPRAQLLRPCYPVPLIPVSQFPNDSTQLSVMVNPLILKNGQSMTLTPQVVADVSYLFQPNFTVFLPKSGIRLWASATLPSPFGGLDQQVKLNSGNNVYTSLTNPALCPVPPGN